MVRTRLQLRIGFIPVLLKLIDPGYHVPAVRHRDLFYAKLEAKRPDPFAPDYVPPMPEES